MAPRSPCDWTSEPQTRLKFQLIRASSPQLLSPPRTMTVVAGQEALLESDNGEDEIVEGEDDTMSLVSRRGVGDLIAGRVR